MKYIPVMGLEIHAELLCDSKVYCSCPNRFGGRENSRVCPICAGLPGTLPSLNRNAVSLAVKAGLALNCKINNYSAFDRKNYFYPDLPKAYQITQFEYPICGEGYLEIEGKKIGIERIHIEEDAGKLTHEGDISLADFNRTGVPLIEIVTKPDFRTVKEVQSFVEDVALRLKYAGVCDARLEEGSLRVDVNISVMPEGSAEFGTRAEIKNLNSIKSIGRAIEYEISRQSEILDRAEKVIQQTRRFDSHTGKTYLMRNKEDADEYRYFPEPDILPIRLSNAEIENIKADMGEMPDKRFIRYTSEYGLAKDDASLLIADKEFSDFYDSAANVYGDRIGTAKMMLGEMRRNMNDTGAKMSDLKFSPQDLAELAALQKDESVSKNAAKDIFKIMFLSGRNPKDIAKTEGFLMDNDTDFLNELTDRVIAENEKSVSEYKNGNKKVFGFLMGIVMRGGGKSVNPSAAKKILEEKLELS